MVTRPAKTNQRTIDLLTSLLTQAKAGEIVGMSCVVLFPDHDYQVYTVGACAGDLPLTASLLSLLRDDLSERIRAGWQNSK